jgi:hypothetical protein
MAPMRSMIPLALCALVGCKNGDAKPPESASSTKAAPTTTAAPLSPTSSAASAVPATAGAGEILVKCTAKSCEVEVVNATEGPLEIVDLLQAERHDDSTWTPAGSALRVTAQCGPEVPKAPCLAIAKGASLHFPTWEGMTCDSRCPCKANARLKPGEYRFVAQVCGSTKRIESAPFAWHP